MKSPRSPFNFWRWISTSFAALESISSISWRSVYCFSVCALAADWTSLSLWAYFTTPDFYFYSLRSLSLTAISLSAISLISSRVNTCDFGTALISEIIYFTYSNSCLEAMVWKLFSNSLLRERTWAEIPPTSALSLSKMTCSYWCFSFDKMSQFVSEIILSECLRIFSSTGMSLASKLGTITCSLFM